MQARASGHARMLNKVRPRGVEKRIVAVSLLVFVGMKNAFISAGLIEESFAVGIHLEPRLAAGPERTHVGLLHGFDAGFLIWTKRAAVKLCHGMGFVHLRANPQTGTNAVAHGAGHGLVAAQNSKIPRLKGL